MNLHFNNFNGPTVGVSFWMGDKIPRVEAACINNNALYFDEFYLLCNKEFANIASNVHQIVSPSLTNDIPFAGGPELRKLLPTPFKPNYGSDMMTYFAREILSLYGVTRYKVMYMDTDYLVYNQFMVREIFDHYDEKFLLLKENNYYTCYQKDWYINACWSFDSGQPEEIRAKALIDHLKDKGNTHYSCMGPHFTNSHHELFAEILNAEPHTFDPRLISSGWNTVNMNPNSLGCHLALTVPREIGYRCTDIDIEKPVFKLKFLYDKS
jgi:hypothetical protein